MGRDLFIIGFSTFVFLAGQHQAFGLGVSLSVDKNQIALGDSVILSLTVADSEGDIPAPQLKTIPDVDLRSLGVREEGASSFTLIINGREVKSDHTGGGKIFEYSLTPRIKKDFEIPADFVTVDGQAYATAPVNIRVVDAVEASQNVLLVLEANNREVFFGERILVTVKWYFNKNIQSYLLNVPWANGSADYILEDPQLDPNKNYIRVSINGQKDIFAEKTNEQKNGVDYTVIQFQKVLIPARSGILSLDPVFLRCDLVTGWKTNAPSGFMDQFFSDDFFGFGREAVTQPAVAKSQNLDLSVLPLPSENIPADFSDGVGSFELAVRADNTKIKAGDPLTVELEISGQGNFPSIKDPVFPDIPSTRSYDPEIASDILNKGSYWEGKKIFKKMYVPSKEGSLEIPAMTFSYFDTVEKKYRTLSAAAAAVDVLPRPEGESALPDPAVYFQKDSEKKELALIGKDIFYIKEYLGEPVRRAKVGISAPLIFLYVIGPLGYILALIWDRNRRKNPEEEKAALKRRAYKTALVRLNRIKGSAGGDSSETFYQELTDILKTYLGAKAGVSAAAISADISVRLESMGMEPGAAVDLKKIFDALDYLRLIRTSASQGEKEDMLKRVSLMIDAIENLLKK